MSNRKLLVLDLDETLVYATKEPLDRKGDFMLGSFHVYKRPHLNEFLQFAANEFDVGVWTSAGAEYANGIVEAIFTNAAPLFLYSSEHCTLCRDLSTGKYVAMKRLSKLKSKGYKLDHIIAVDDSPEKHKDN